MDLFSVIFFFTSFSSRKIDQQLNVLSIHFSSNPRKNVYHKTTVGVNNIFKELNSNKLTLNIRESNYNTFDDIVIHSCDKRDLNFKLCNCKK